MKKCNFLYCFIIEFNLAQRPLRLPKAEKFYLAGSRQFWLETQRLLGDNKLVHDPEQLSPGSEVLSSQRGRKAELPGWGLSSDGGQQAPICPVELGSIPAGFILSAARPGILLVYSLGSHGP